VRSPERGAATAELVTALPLLVLVTWTMVWLVSLGSAQAELVDAARETARALARGDAEPVAIARGRDSAPAGTVIEVVREGAMVQVVARVDVAAPVATFGLMVAHEHAEATTEVEPCAEC
jgi:hypothetical protein